MPTIRRPLASLRRPSAPCPGAVRRGTPSALPPLVAIAALLVGGCATTSGTVSTEPALPEDPVDSAVDYTVQSGDRLGDIALRFTGDIALWEEIAASNGIDDPRSLRAGSVLRIPGELIPGRAESLAAREVVPEADASPRTRTAASAGLAARRADPVELSPVDVNRRFELSPLDADDEASVAEDDRGAALDAVRTSPVVEPRRLRVVGSYFPKGVYAQPASYSRLIMRVAPGTLFELDGEVGDWYGVVTENGVGYLRDIDGKVLEDGSRAALADARG